MVSMTPWVKHPPTIITENFSKLAVAFHQAIARREIIGVVSPDGIGFKYALSHFAEKHYLKVVYCNVQHNESIRQVLLSVYKHLCNIKFSNINHKRVSFHELVRVLNSRLTYGDNCLLCIDECCNLKPGQLKYFAQFLKDFNKPIGLVFRMEESYAKDVVKNKKYITAYKSLRKRVDNWRVLGPCTDNEVREIAFTHVKDKILLEDLVSASKGNLSMLIEYIQRIQKFQKQ